MPSFLFNNGTFFPDGGIAPQAATPIAGAVISMSGPSLFLTPAGTLATLTVRLPAGPSAGDMASIVSTAAVTTLTMQTATGGAVSGAPTALVVNTKVTMLWVVTSAGVGSWVWVK
jgi:hypothetical protein